jgi:uncharacterized protein (DUF488 family)
VTIYTIGVYGFDAETFIAKLRSARVTSVVDIRRRRGVRGSAYRFANATSLATLLNSNGIRYFPELRLAPTEDIRGIQRRRDALGRVAKSAREELAPDFVAAYKDDVLAAYSDDDIDALLGRSGDSPALLCVERTPAACHRRLAAEGIAARFGAPIIDLIS